MTYTNTGLVQHCEKALSLPTKYMWGGILRPIEKQYDMLFRMYGTSAGTGYTAARWDELAKLRGKGYYGVDCVGLIKSYYWSGNADGGTGSPKYGAAGFPDVNANYMFRQAKIKGTIDTIPEVPGIVVYCSCRCIYRRRPGDREYAIQKGRRRGEIKAVRLHMGILVRVPVYRIPEDRDRKYSQKHTDTPPRLPRCRSRGCIKVEQAC